MARLSDNPNEVQFVISNSSVVTVHSYNIPAVGEVIQIARVDYKITRRIWALDALDDHFMRVLRVIYDVEKVEE